MKLKLSAIECDEDVQPRAYMDGSVISEYSALMKEGTVFPPVVVFDDGKVKWLACGFHRYYAAEEAGFENIEADVRKGIKRDAMLFAVGTNAMHGMRRTNADKRRAVETLLKDKEWRKRDSAWIADAAKVSKQSVLRWRKELQELVPGQKLTTRKGKQNPAAKSSKPKILPGIEAKKRAYEEALQEQVEAIDETKPFRIHGSEVRLEPDLQERPDRCPTCGQRVS